MKQKICTICRKVKFLSKFVKRRAGSADGYYNKCKDCHAAYARKWKIDNPNGVGPLAVERRRYAVHKSDAKRRGILFHLTFEQWLQIWTDSGHLHESGSFSGQYHMARFGDIGAYEVGNVRICTAEENHMEMRHSAASRAKIAENNRIRWLQAGR